MVNRENFPPGTTTTGILFSDKPGKITVLSILKIKQKVSKNQTIAHCRKNDEYKEHSCSRDRPGKIVFFYFRN
jgi:hypothetical protein